GRAFVSVREQEARGRALEVVGGPGKLREARGPGHVGRATDGCASVDDVHALAVAEDVDAVELALDDLALVVCDSAREREARSEAVRPERRRAARVDEV